MKRGSQIRAFYATGGSHSLHNLENESPPLKVGSGLGIPSPPAIAFTQNQRDEVRTMKEAGSISAQPGVKQQTFLLTSSAEDSRAKTSASPAGGPDSQVSDQGSSSNSSESQASLFVPEGTHSSRMFPDYFPPTKVATSPSYSRRWPTAGFTTSPGECWTLDISEYPSGGGGSSSLADSLHRETVPARFSLSQKAAAGILRRAEKRGREIPPELLEALTEVASQEP